MRVAAEAAAAGRDRYVREAIAQTTPAPPGDDATKIRLHEAIGSSEGVGPGTPREKPRMPRSPYRIARQEHQGEILDRLQSLGLLNWKWGYEVRTGRQTGSAIYWVTEPGRPTQKLDTKRAEELAIRLCKQESIVWLPVPHPGGETQRAETQRKIEELKRGIRPTETNTTTRIPPIKPVPFDLATYPELERQLRDEPSGDRSAQTFSAARRCVELGLHDGQVKTFLAQYPPFLDKYAERTGADRELDRVITKAREDASG